MTPPPSLESRLTNIEQALAALSAEVAAIRAESVSAQPNRVTAPHDVASQPVGTSAPTPRAPSRLAPVRRLTSHDFESLVGRYGVLGIAVLAAAAAVGTFLSWAMSHGYLTLSPAARVLAGMAFAIAIAVVGVRLRRTERSFGSSLLGLALVIENVCAYAAGPSLHLVPGLVAFVGTAAIAMALAAFAHTEDDEPLWCVGFGGAAVAPFVTSDGHGSVYALAAYAVIVLLLACFAINRRAWPVAWRVFYLVSAVFVVACASQVEVAGANGFLVAFALPFVVAVGGVVPFASSSRKRGALRWLALLAVVAGFANYGAHDDARIIVAAMVAAVGLWLVLLDRSSDIGQSSIVASARQSPGVLDWIDAAGIPLALALRASDIGGLFTTPMPYVAASVFLVAFAARRTVSSLRDAAAFAAVASAIGAAFVMTDQVPAGRILAFIALGLAAIGLHTFRPSMSWLLMGLALLAFSAAFSATVLIARPMYQFTPFTTQKSAVALLVALAFMAVALLRGPIAVATREALSTPAESPNAAAVDRVSRTITVAPWAWAFIWVLIELWMAYSPSTSTLLLVVWDPLESTCRHASLSIL